MINSEFRKKMADSWFSYLQMQICKSFEQLENNKLQFTKRDWHKKIQSRPIRDDKGQQRLGKANEGQERPK